MRFSKYLLQCEIEKIQTIKITQEFPVNCDLDSIYTPDNNDNDSKMSHQILFVVSGLVRKEPRSGSFEDKRE